MIRDEHKGQGAGFRLIQGGLQREMVLDGVRIVAAPEDRPPFTVEAVAAEEDTFLVLSADKTVREPTEHPLRIMTRLIEMRPEAPGSVLVKGRSPLKLLAIIHDLNQEPTWREAWVEKALHGIFLETESRKLRSVALPLLGSLHGSLDKERFAVLLRRALEKASLIYLKRLWLIVPTGAARDLIGMLESYDGL